MRARRHLTLTVTALGAVVALGGCSAAGAPTASTPQTVVYEADYPEYDSFAQAVNAASTIVTGTIVGSRTVEIYPDASTDTNPLTNPQAGVPAAEAAQIPAIVTTVFDVKVGSVIEGVVAVGDVIQVSQLGGTVRDVHYVEKSSPELSRGRPYAFLLADHGKNVPFDLINPAQGTYTVEGDTYVPTSERGFKGASRLAVVKALR